MENQLEKIIEMAQINSPYNTDNKEELIEILKNNGGENFAILGNCIFTTNEHGIIEGIGFDSMGNFKVWKNTNFGTFKK